MAGRREPAAPTLRPGDVSRTEHSHRVQAVVLAAALLGAACGSAGPPASSAAQSPGLSIANGTILPVTLVVNGTAIETVAPGGYQDPITASLPPLPWVVEARTPSGRLLTSMTVHAGDTWSWSLPNGEGGARGDAARVDLSCGRLDIWTGPEPIGPAPGTGAPGDCAP